jgi:predicted neutral ceramidase superfamily lipid hydrolase
MVTLTYIGTYHPDRKNLIIFSFGMLGMLLGLVNIILISKMKLNRGLFIQIPLVIILSTLTYQCIDSILTMYNLGYIPCAFCP